MQHLKWIAVPVFALSLIFLFFGLIWQGVVQLAVGLVLAGLAAVVWRTSSGTWPLAQA